MHAKTNHSMKDIWNTREKKNTISLNMSQQPPSSPMKNRDPMVNLDGKCYHYRWNFPNNPPLLPRWNYKKVWRSLTRWCRNFMSILTELEERHGTKPRFLFHGWKLKFHPNWNTEYHLNQPNLMFIFQGVWSIYLREWLIFMVNEGKCTSPMEGMGLVSEGRKKKIWNHFLLKIWLVYTIQYRNSIYSDQFGKFWWLGIFRL